MAAPPLSEGGEYAIVMLWFPGMALVMVGAPGVVEGVAEAEAEALPAPLVLTACRSTLYNCPLVSPVMVNMLSETSEAVVYDPPLREYW